MSIIAKVGESDRERDLEVENHGIPITIGTMTVFPPIDDNVKVYGALSLSRALDHKQFRLFPK